MDYEARMRVRYGETDQMGIVYHPNYYIYFELGRTETLREISGISYNDMEKSGIMIPLIETQCQYILPARYDDELIVLTSLTALTVARVTFSYELLRAEDRAVLARGKTSHAFVNKKGRPINLKKVDKELYDKLLKNKR